MQSEVYSIGRIARITLPLLTIVPLTIIVRIYADRAGEHVVPYLGTYFTKELAAVGGLSWWQYLLPIKELSGRWAPTGFLFVHWLELKFPEPGTFYLLSAVMVATAYVLAYLTFRSSLLATLFGIGMGTTTFNYHVYAVSGSVIMLPLVTLLLLFSFCQVHWVRFGGAGWAMATVLSCFLFMLSYEGWLDFVPIAWIIYPALAWQFARGEDRNRAFRCCAMLALVTVTAFSYIAIKVGSGLEGLHPKGGEADLITTYGQYRLLMIEDLVSSYFTFFYTTLTTYFPPELFSFSLSLWYYGPQKVVALQEGYHAQAAHLTHYNHLFLWRYFAGFAFAIFLWSYWKVVMSFVQRREVHHLILFVLMTSVLVQSPSHLIIKWRPMHSAPLLGYQVYLSIIGWTLLLCYWVDRKARQYGSWRAVALSALLSCVFLYCAYARPALLSCMASEVFLGTYPDPRENLPIRDWSAAKTAFCGPASN